MRVKLRPGVHFVPVPRGIQWHRGADTFLLAAPPALYRVLDAQVGRLAAGTSLDELVAAVGDPAARPVLDRVLRALVERDVMLDLDAVTGPLPGAGDAATYAEVLAYLEAHCAQPYARFAALRAARVAVRGDGPAVPVLRRTLSRYGVTVVDDGPADAAVWVDAVPDSEGALRVRCGPHVALLGTGPGFDEGYRRAAAWAAAEPEERAPWPLSAVLAGSLAAHRVLARLAGTDPDPGDATVVYGRHVATRRLPLPSAGSTAPAGTLSTVDDLPDVATAWVPFTARFGGLVRRGSDERLAQLPLSLATASTVDGGAPAAGWGTDRAEATTQALLAAARRLVPPGPGTPAAGATGSRWLMDGALRLLGAELLDATAGEPVEWTDLGDDRSRSLWELMEEYFARPVRLRLRPLPGTDWALASTDGELTVGEWGPDPATAVRTGLAAAVAAAQADPAVRDLLTAERTGTQVLGTLSGDRLDPGARQLAKLFAHRGTRITGTALSTMDGPGYGPVWEERS